MLKIVASGKEWRGEVVNGVRHPSNIEALWTDADLAVAGFVRIPPAPPVPPAPRRTGTFIEFMDRFSPAEQARILVAARRNPALDLVLLRASAANSIDLDDPRLAAALQQFVAAGIVDSATAADVQKVNFE